HQTDMLFREAQKPNEICTGIHWNPLHDGTDSQELQLKAGIEIACLGKDMWFVRSYLNGEYISLKFDPTNTDDLREKIVLCAAEKQRRSGK
ncbi:MAG: hypothetical protein KGL39_16615, partial [Patescibacteria group bacterium]|nr:hypothetical protein [Patescibacteria group bacterium]